MGRLLIVLWFGLLGPGFAKADALLLEEFAVFQSEIGQAAATSVRRQIVLCLQMTSEPRTCIGASVQACDGVFEECAIVEAAAWERFGYDLYLELRRALGGPEWIDTAHARIGTEILARCEARVLEAGEASRHVCQLSEAAGRALDLRFALVAP